MERRKGHVERKKDRRNARRKKVGRAGRKEDEKERSKE